VDPFISIVTVSLNAAATIGDTIASVSMQATDFSFEHICVDGGSSDYTRDVIDRWASQSGHIRIIYETDHGIFDAMNKGLRAARGEYVLFLNADDFLVARTSLATAMAGLLPGAPENPDLVVGDVAMGELGRRGLWRHRRVPRLLGRLRGFGLFPLHQGQFTQRRLLEAVGGFNSRLRWASDVIQYYELERRFRPSTLLVRSDIAFMRAGGAANAGVKARYLATVEFFRHLLLTHNVLKTTVMVLVKSLQSLAELRYGQCPHDRWFAVSANYEPPSTAPPR
jgi:glycosyltransferase involved in cell wall biosynthesis